MIIKGTYGSDKVPCEIYVYHTFGQSWYAVEGSSNVNATLEDLADGVDVETISDIDYFNWPDGINSLEELEEAVNA